MIKNILFDFDGVILDSMPIREYGFRKIFESYDDSLVAKLLEFHNQNGGLSRYVKIRYFFEELLNQHIQEEKVLELAEEFSLIMKKELINKKYLISDTVEFIDNNFEKYNLHIVSGSDERELQYLCKELEIDKYFISIYGSPIPKNDIVKNILNTNNYNQNETILIGDSINDYEAAKINNIDFYGFNNNNLKSVSKTYIEKFNNFIFFDYGIGEISHSIENKTFYNISDKTKTIDYLLFFDSRGLTIDKCEYDNSHLMQLIDKLIKENKTYIAISRPKNLTIFATLLNFLRINKNIRFNYLITNLGFVDLTPKKKDILDDMYKQISFLYSDNIPINELSAYPLSNGYLESLYSLSYTNDYIRLITEEINNYVDKKSFFINTLLVSSEINIERERPKEFFENLQNSNNLLENIVSLNNDFHMVDINNIEEITIKNITYDAVHLTKKGHLYYYKNIDNKLGLIL